MDFTRPETVAITAGRPASAPGAPLNTGISLNSTFTAGGELGYAPQAVLKPRAVLQPAYDQD